MIYINIKIKWMIFRLNILIYYLFVINFVNKYVLMNLKWRLSKLIDIFKFKINIIIKSVDKLLMIYINIKIKWIKLKC
jgi:hypothetical protein